MTFFTWVKQFVDEQSPRGDLARDILSDEDFPKRAGRLKIYEYIESVGGSDLAITAFEDTWEQYVAIQDGEQ